MNEELKNIYESKVEDFTRIVESFPDDDVAGPLLIKPNDLYFRQSKRLMIIGQQTNGWSYYYKDIEKQLRNYEEFNLGEEYYSSPFWNVTRKLEKAIGNDEYSCVWTNINKFDLDANRPYGKYEELISTVDSILINEIEILEPNICIFFTGPSFDYRIRKIFSGVEFKEIQNWKLGQLCQLKHKYLPKCSVRTHHPKSLRIRHFEDDFIEYIQTQST